MKKTTMMDIANKVGVSKATVSMVINNKDGNISKETREKIMDAADELGYIPNSVARSLSTRKSGSIGIILPDILNPFFSEMSRAIEDAANELDYNVIFCNTDNEINKEEKYIKLLISKLVDGVIFMTGGKSNHGIDILKNNGIPFVLVDRYIEGYQDLYGVFCKNKEGIKEGVKYLFKKGKRKIAFAAGPKDIHVFSQRREGYKEAMREYGLGSEEIIVEAEPNIEGGIFATTEILNKSKDVEAIIYSSDVMALGGMKVLNRNKYSVPEDINIIGFDNIQLSQFIEPELTTISQPIYYMGKEACTLLIDIINKKDSKKQIFFTPELIIRGTA